jgi:DNA-binding PadR family transcriptional regulator
MPDPHDARDHQLPEIAHVILGYVAMYPEGVHGYRLGRTLARAPLGLPALRLGQVYRALRHLERQGFVRSEIESGGPRPARHRFTVTPDGAAAFRAWLTSVPHGPEPLRDQMLNRLRFVDRLPPAVVESLLREAVGECDAELEALRRHQSLSGATEGRLGGVKPLVGRLMEMRLVADRRWLDEVRRLIERLYGAPDKNGAMRVPAPA